MGKNFRKWDTVIKREEYEKLFFNQQATMEAPKLEQPEPVEEPVLEPVVIKKPEPVPQKPKNTYVTGQYGVKPTVSMAAEEKTPYAAAKPAQPEKKPEIDLSGVTEGTVVQHKAFGRGTVTKIDKAGKHIRIKFESGEKNFIFPDAFNNGFLKLSEE